jgi:transmembrane sensor
MAQDTDAETRLTHHAAEWLARAELGGRTDRLAFIDWLKQDAEHVRALLEMYAMRAEASRAVRDSRLTERIRYARKVIRFPRAPDPARALLLSGNGTGVGRRRLAAFAAVIAVLALIALLTRLGDGARYETASGEKLTVQLRDGSQVRLNSGTKIRERFGARERGIELIQGEALFDVAHDVTRPFRVRTGTSIVQALGTQFDVRRRGDSLAVLVTSGRVAFSIDSPAKQGAIPLALSAGQALLVRTGLDAGAAEVRALTAEEELQILYWSDGRIVLIGTPVREAVERFNRFNETQLVIDDEDVGRFPLGGTFRLSRPEDFATALRKLGIGVRKDTSGNGALHLYRVRPAAAHESESAPLIRAVP